MCHKLVFSQKKKERRKEKKRRILGFVVAVVTVCLLVETVSHWPRIHYVVEGGLRLTEICLPEWED